MLDIYSKSALVWGTSVVCGNMSNQNVLFVKPITAAEEAAREEKMKLKKELKQFWKDLAPVLQKQPALYDIARKDYEVKDLLIPQDLEDQEQKVCALNLLSLLMP